jgi:chemotaxis protein CheD
MILDKRKEMIDSSEHVVYVGFGECKVSSSPNDVLVALGLGSCVAVVAWCPQNKIGGMVHVVLPSSGGRTVPFPEKFADTGIPLLIKRIIHAGGVKETLKVKIIGGAEIFKSPASSTKACIGRSNVNACLDVLNQLHLKPEKEEVGGKRGRTVRLYVGSGKVVVKSMDGEKEI